MANSEEMIDRIVAGVLGQLASPSGGASSPPERIERRSIETSPDKTLEIAEEVVTAAYLENRGIISGPIAFAAKSVLTPSAREFLANRKIAWTRSSRSGSAATTGRGNWLTVIVRSTPAVAAAFDLITKDSDGAWSREFLGCHREAAARGVGALCRGECDGVVVFTGKPESVACRANRNPQVRAAAVATVGQVKGVRAVMGANLFAVDPRERSMFELRNLLKEIESAGKPAPPAGWNE
jgi:hypothetical protein